MLQYVWPKLLVWSMWQNDIVLFFDPDVSASIRLPCGSRAFSTPVLIVLYRTREADAARLLRRFPFFPATQVPYWPVPGYCTQRPSYAAPPRTRL